MTGWTTATHWPDDLIRVGDLTRPGLEELLDLAAAMKAEPEQWSDAFPGASVTCLFETPTTRAGLSTEAAAHRLGMEPIRVRPGELRLGRDEPLQDAARILSRYTAAIVARDLPEHDLSGIARAADAPVINAMSPRHHPCQALADLLTLRERFGDLHGLRLVYVGDGNNVARSLAILGRTAGVEVVVASPQGYGLEQGLAAKDLDDPREAVADADAVYTDVWVSMGDEAEAQRRRADLAPYRVDSALLDAASDRAIALHCLPAHPGDEITEDVLYGERSAVWDQAENRLHAQKALLELLLG
jgi:ornithine carbamoyltransferase